MSSFDNRKDAFENKYAHDEELKFKIEARCCKLFGLWVAEQLGLSGADAETYAKDVVAANLEEPGFEDVKRKVMPDLNEKDVTISDHLINSMLEQCLAQAVEQITESQ